MIGSVVNYRYEILEKIGDGSFFSVYRARDKVLNRLVAVKVLQPRYAENEEFAQRMSAEIQTCSELTHPGIARTYECDRQDGVWFVAEEYVRSTNLKERIKRTAPMTVSAAVDIAIAVCEALGYAHRQGFVHGDVRPQNILVSPEGTAKLTAFGVAPALAGFPTVQASSMFHSVHYTAPEVAEGKPPQPASDLYSLGVVLYEMLTGTVPFDAETPIGVALKHAKDPPQPPHELNAGIPRGLEAIVIKALEKSPNARYSGARAMLDELLEVRDALRMGRPVRRDIPEAEPEVERERPVSLLPSAFKSLMWILAVAVVVAVSFVAYLSWSNPPEVTVPDIVGRTLEEATTMADLAGVELVVADERFNDRYSEGEIYLTNPVAGTRIKKGKPVRAWISKGSRYAEVPDVTDMPEVRAREAILAADLTVGDVNSAYDDKVAAGSVARQSPKPGSRHERGSAVNLVLSTGPKPEETPVDEETTDGTGRRAFDVKFSVPDDSPDPSRVKIAVIDSDGRNTVYDEELHPGDPVNTTVYGYGSRVEIRVYLNNEEVSKETQ